MTEYRTSTVLYSATKHYYETQATAHILSRSCFITRETIRKHLHMSLCDKVKAHMTLSDEMLELYELSTNPTATVRYGSEATRT